MSRTDKWQEAWGLTKRRGGPRGTKQEVLGNSNWGGQTNDKKHVGQPSNKKHRAPRGTKPEAHGSMRRNETSTWDNQAIRSMRRNEISTWGSQIKRTSTKALNEKRGVQWKGTSKARGHSFFGGQITSKVTVFLIIFDFEPALKVKWRNKWLAKTGIFGRWMERALMSTFGSSHSLWESSFFFSIFRYFDDRGEGIKGD